MSQERIHLVIIDPQNDFCDLPDAYLPAHVAGKARTAPSLPVTGAHADMLRIAALIDAAGNAITDISVTLDSHQHIDIAHPTFWRDARGDAIGAFTQITAADVRAGRYVPRLEGALPRVLAYLDQLEAAGRYTHMVWPVHCEIGTWGHNVHRDVLAAYNRWEEATLRTVNKVVKGTNPWTEHYSAVRAEVPDPADAATELNAAFIAQLREADRILITGEAGSHCVKATTEHIAEQLGAQRLTLLVDCMSPVSGFEPQYRAFIEAMRARGATIATSTDVLPTLQAALACAES
ncbi:isochorismatase family protein [Niveibacterium sp. COAC-50]|uniref:isochorismatase family protein n=1 Tax=Niveibacterium sp. COAC-50 TaxID=2729384 RepID=UPI001554DAD4|nr:isochorismatase family protein [Niveibacterium sp. COAC-50]